MKTFRLRRTVIVLLLITWTVGAQSPQSLKSVLINLGAPSCGSDSPRQQLFVNILNHPISKFILLTVCLYALNASSARARLNFSVLEPTVTYPANSGSTTVIAGNIDDLSSGAVNIGFSFTYGCNTYTQFLK